MSSGVREREHDPELLPPAGAWSYISKSFVFMAWHLINLRDMITFTSRYVCLSAFYLKVNTIGIIEDLM
jgi:hypothetical protein